MNYEEIAYQNKDITSKALADHLKGKSFRVYGLDIPEIKQVLPTNIPAVKANELRLDHLFELVDGTVAVVDYESDYEKADKIKYLGYLAGIASRYQKEKKDCPVLRMIVIYTGDISRKQVVCEYNIGALKLNIEPAFLSELDGNSIYLHLKEKVLKGIRLTDEDLMEFIILPLSYRKKEEKGRKVKEVVELAVHIQDRGQQVFALSGILAFTDKIIDRQTANKIRRAIEMTQVAQIFEEEKRQALTQVAQIFEEEKQQAVKLALTQAEKEFEEEKKQFIGNTTKKVVIRMIELNYPIEEILSLMPDYSRQDVEDIRKEIAD